MSSVACFDLRSLYFTSSKAASLLTLPCIDTEAEHKLLNQHQFQKPAGITPVIPANLAEALQLESQTAICLGEDDVHLEPKTRP